MLLFRKSVPIVPGGVEVFPRILAKRDYGNCGKRRIQHAEKNEHVPYHYSNLLIFIFEKTNPMPFEGLFVLMWWQNFVIT